MPPPASDCPPAAEARLTCVLAEEVRSRAYADLLRARAEAARDGVAVSGASGNAYYVTFQPDGVVIEHHFLTSWVPLRVPVPVFLNALDARRARLDASQ